MYHLSLNTTIFENAILVAISSDILFKWNLNLKFLNNCIGFLLKTNVIKITEQHCDH